MSPEFPARTTVRFYVEIGEAKEPREFAGRIIYDPLPNSIDKSHVTDTKGEDHFVSSNLLEYTVVGNN
jgi:hypothetical protein